MEVRVSYVRRRLSRGVMCSSVARKRRSLSGTACGPSFTRFGSSNIIDVDVNFSLSGGALE